MEIKSITINNLFKNNRFTFTPGPGVNIIFGPNRSGKTSFLRAVVWGFLGGNDDEVITRGSQAGFVKIEIGDRHRTVEFVREKIRGKDSRLKIKENGKAVNASPVTFLGTLFSPFQFDPTSFFSKPFKEQRQLLVASAGVSCSLADLQARLDAVDRSVPRPELGDKTFISQLQVDPVTTLSGLSARFYNARREVGVQKRNVEGSLKTESEQLAANPAGSSDATMENLIRELRDLSTQVARMESLLPVPENVQKAENASSSGVRALIDNVGDRLNTAEETANHIRAEILKRSINADGVCPVMNIPCNQGLLDHQNGYQDEVADLQAKLSRLNEELSVLGKERSELNTLFQNALSIERYMSSVQAVVPGASVNDLQRLYEEKKARLDTLTGMKVSEIQKANISRARIAELRERHKSLEASYEAYTRLIDAIASVYQSMVEQVSAKVPGLSFSKNEMLYQGVPVSLSSDSERKLLGLSLLRILANTVPTKFVFVDAAESFDAVNLLNLSSFGFDVVALSVHSFPDTAGFSITPIRNFQ